MNDIYYWVALHKVSGIGPVRFRNLINYFGSAEDVWLAKPEELREVEGITEQVCQNLAKGREKINPEVEWNKLEKNGIEILTLNDADYPGLLKEIYDPPPIIYLKGKLENSQGANIAVVGTRQPTIYGKNVATRFCRELVNAGVGIISGLARGIDTFAHKSALMAKGYTVAVLGSGLDNIYPPENRELAKNIIENGGAVITEFPLGTKPEPWNFPARNRIISGLALGTLVIEAPESSGALISTDFALEQGREVFAVPGSIDNPQSRGCHRLIKQGAKLVHEIQDILDEIVVNRTSNSKKPVQQSLFDFTPEEQQIVSILGMEPQHIDEIITRSTQRAETVNAILMLLEVKGAVKQLQGKYFQLA